MKIKNIKSEGKMIKKGETNAGLPSKQYFEVLSHKDYEKTLVIRKLVLVDDHDYKSVKMYDNSFLIIKFFKDKILYRQNVSIKVSTLKEIFDFVNSL